MHDLTHSDGQSEALLIRLSRMDTIGCLAFHSNRTACNRVSRLPQCFAEPQTSPQSILKTSKVPYFGNGEDARDLIDTVTSGQWMGPTRKVRLSGLLS